MRRCNPEEFGTMRAEGGRNQGIGQKPSGTVRKERKRLEQGRRLSARKEAQVKRVLEAVRDAVIRENLA